MTHYEFVGKEMIVSRTARRVYRVAAVLSLTIYLSLGAIRVNGPSPLLKQLLFIGVLSTALVLVGMEFFLFRFDDSSAWKQIFWFVLMLFAPLGPALYCFIVYSRSKALRAACAPQEDAALIGTNN